MCLCDWELNGEWDREREPVGFLGHWNLIQVSATLSSDCVKETCPLFLLPYDTSVRCCCLETVFSDSRELSPQVICLGGNKLTTFKFEIKDGSKNITLQWRCVNWELLNFQARVPIYKQEWTMFQERAGSPISFGTAFPWGTENIKSNLFNFSLKCEIQFKYVC